MTQSTTQELGSDELSVSCELLPEQDAPPRQNRLLLLIVAVATTVPFFWAAIRDARNGFYPTMDVAATVVRSRDVLSSQPPLLGMWSSGSSWAGSEIHFPGPIQLYILGPPSHLLGNVWGPLLTMAVLNAFWMLLTGWLIYRRLGTNAALIGFLFLNLFIWSIGSENLIDPRPMEMVTIPFLCFLVAAWLVAAGDLDALPALALVANFLFLDHLVQAVQIPVITLAALVGLGLALVRTRRSRAPDDGPGPNKIRRRLLQTGVITLIMWLPSLIQELTTSPGNLTLLVQATGNHRTPVGSVVVGYNATIGLIAQPPFWFRGRFDDYAFHHGLDTLTVGNVLGGCILAAIILGLGVSAWRRRDRVSLAALAISVVAILISIETVIQAPSIWGFMPYLRSLWGLAAFVWFTIVLCAWRLAREPLRTHGATVCGIGAAIFAVMALSYADYGSATSVFRGPRAKKMINAVVPQVEGRGKVAVQAGPDFVSQRYFSALLLGLNTAGVHYCVTPEEVRQYGSFHDCADQAAVTLSVQSWRAPASTNKRLIAHIKPLSPEQARARDAARAEIDRWLSKRREITLTSQGEAFLDTFAPEIQEEYRKILAPDDGDLSGVILESGFNLLLTMEQFHRKAPADHFPVFADQDMPVEVMRTYLQLLTGTNSEHIYVYLLDTNKG